jgi:hypothetical protein
MNDLQNSDKMITNGPIQLDKGYSKSQLNDFKSLRHVIMRNPDSDEKNEASLVISPNKDLSQKEDIYSNFMPSMGVKIHDLNKPKRLSLNELSGRLQNGQSELMLPHISQFDSEIQHISSTTSKMQERGKE